MQGQKKERQKWVGKCSFCGGIFPKSGMTNHLELCEQRKMSSMKPSQEQNSKHRHTRIFHLVVEGSKQPQYWMHLDVPADIKLQKLDDFLRKTWVECCGHLSAFTIDKIRYEQDFGDSKAIYYLEKLKNMNIRLGTILYDGLKFHYEYDFGTTTCLTLRVLSEREEESKDKSIQILARNESPQIICEMCGKLATQVCPECIYEGNGWFCDKCAQEHECGEDMMLPVVNSPRVGMCGYTG